MRSLERLGAGLEIVALLGAAIWALLFHATLPSRLPADSDYRQLQEYLAQNISPGDVVLLFPWWTERARLFVPKGTPVVGHLGSEGDPLTDFPRVWVLSQPRLPRADVHRFQTAFLPGRTPLTPPRRFGALELSLYRNDRYQPLLFSAQEALRTARVYLERPDGSRVPCPFDGVSHRCPGRPEVYVAVEWHEIHFAPRRCLWFHPPGGATRLVAEFSNVPSGHWELEGGLVWDRGFFTTPGLSETHLGIEEVKSGQTRMALTLRPGDEGEKEAGEDVENSGPEAVRIWAQAQNPELRDLCLEFFSREKAARR